MTPSTDEGVEWGALFDSDNHYYEPSDCFTRHIDPKLRHRTLRAARDSSGRDVALVGDRVFTFLEQPFLERVAKPGALREMLRNLSSGDVRSHQSVEDIQPEYRDRDARLATMDRQGLESIFILPTLGVTVEHFVRDDIDLTYAMLRAFNTWLDEDWGFDHRGRIYAPPLMSLLDVDRAVIELDWVLERGAKVIHLRPGPQGGRSPADPVFDPFWARVNEAGTAVAFHVSESGYNEQFSAQWGELPNPASHRQSAFQWTNFFGDRPIMDTVSALILHNLFGRFPNVRVASLENGSLWVRYLMKAMDKMSGMGRNGPWIGGPLTARPSDILRQHVHVAPYHEEPIVELTELIGAERVLFGSDFPHAEGLAVPSDFAEGLAGLSEDAVRLIMGGNARRLVGAS